MIYSLVSFFKWAQVFNCVFVVIHCAPVVVFDNLNVLTLLTLISIQEKKHRGVFGSLYYVPSGRC